MNPDDFLDSLGVAPAVGGAPDDADAFLDSLGVDPAEATRDELGFPRVRLAPETSLTPSGEPGSIDLASIQKRPKDIEYPRARVGMGDVRTAESHPDPDVMEAGPFRIETPNGVVTRDSAGDSRVSINPMFAVDQPPGYRGGGPSIRTDSYSPQYDPRAVVEGYGQGATFNMADEIAARGLSHFRGTPYDTELAARRAELGRNSQDPGFTGGEFLGAATTLPFIPTPATALGRAGAAGGISALYGAGGATEGQRTSGAIRGGAQGLAIGGAFELAPAIASGLVSPTGRLNRQYAADSARVATADLRPYDLSPSLDRQVIHEGAEVLRGNSPSQVGFPEANIPAMRGVDARRNAAVALGRRAGEAMDALSEELGPMDVLGNQFTLQQLRRIKLGETVQGVDAVNLARRWSGNPDLPAMAAQGVVADIMESAAGSNAGRVRMLNREYQVADRIASAEGGQGSVGSSRIADFAASPVRAIGRMTGISGPPVGASTFGARVERQASAWMLETISALSNSSPELLGVYAPVIQQAVSRGTLPAVIWGLSSNQDFRDRMDTIRNSQDGSDAR